MKLFTTEYFDKKAKQYFELTLDHTPIDNQVYRIFDDFVKRSTGPYVIECSFKIYQDKLLSARRLQYWFDENTSEKIVEFQPVLEQFEKLGFKINRSLHDILFGNMEISKVSRFVAGYDLRTDMGNSRIEIWYQLEDQPDLVDKVLAKHGLNKSIEQLLNKNKLAVGVDFNHDGSTKFKIYPFFPVSGFSNIYINSQHKAEKIFSERVMEILENVNNVYPSYKDQDLSRILHLDFKDPGKFIHTCLKNELLNSLIDKIEMVIWENVYIAMPESEIDSPEGIKRINFYY